MGLISVSNIRDTLRRLYKSSGPFQKFLVINRPLICPFETLLEHVPEGSTVLDIGCGSGVFLNLASEYRGVQKGIGVDVSKPAITAARQASSNLTSDQSIEFIVHSVEEDLPAGSFDVVSMIDVIHHIPPSMQKSAIQKAAHRVVPGGSFLFKDMVEKPFWRAWANRLHDLILARQWIHYVPSANVVAWMQEIDFELTHTKSQNLYWYGHELLVFRKK